MEFVSQTLATAKELVAIPLRAATSKSAQKAYLATVIFGILAIALLGISTISFLVFYNVYIPEIGIERPLHLQFGQGHPFARTDLGGSLTSNQPYDITISLVLPRTPSNIATGNFMLELALLPPNVTQIERLPLVKQILDITAPPIATSRRPAILTYTSPVVDLAQTLSSLPLYTFGWRTQRETVEVSMFEGVEFSRGAGNIPDRVQLAIEADDKMQFYSASVKVHAKFQGLRWILYNYRITSFIVFTSSFFVVSLVSTLLIYIAFTFGTSPVGKSQDRIKREANSETGESSKTIKQEADILRPTTDAISAGVVIKKEDFESLESSDIPALGGEADDEDEEDEEDIYDGNTSGWRDSGIGTGREDSRKSSGKKRRSYVN